MMNGRANQLTEMVPIERSFSELQRYINAGATEYFLVNTSDIRPVTMSVRAVMDAVWKGLPAEGEAAQDKFYQEWSKQEFGDKRGPASSYYSIRTTSKPQPIFHKRRNANTATSSITPKPAA